MMKLALTYKQKKRIKPRWRSIAMLFIKMHHVLVVMTERAIADGQNERVISHLMDGNYIYSDLILKRLRTWN